MPLHKVLVADTTLLHVPYSFCCKANVKLAKESCNHFVGTSPTKCIYKILKNKLDSRLLCNAMWHPGWPKIHPWQKFL